MATAIQLPPAPVTSNDPSQAHAEQEETQTGEFYIVRVDASTNVEVPGGCFVTVESGPHTGLPQALHNLAHPKARAHTTPDIVFLPTTCTVWAKNEVVPAKPRLIISSTSLQIAREPKLDSRDAKRRRMVTRGLSPSHQEGPPSMQQLQQQTPPATLTPHPKLQPQVQLRPQLVQSQAGQPRLILPYGLQWGVQGMQGGIQRGLQRITLPQGGVVMLPLGTRIGPVPGGNNMQQMRPVLTAVSSQGQGQGQGPNQGLMQGQMMGAVRPQQTMGALHTMQHNYIVTSAPPSLTPVPAPIVTPPSGPTSTTPAGAPGAQANVTGLPGAQIEPNS